MTTLTIVLIIAGSFLYVTSNLLLAFVYAATSEEAGGKKFFRIAFFFSVILLGVPIYAVLFFLYFLDVAGHSRLFYVLTHKKKFTGMTEDKLKLYNELISDKKGMICYTNDRISRYFVNRWNRVK